MVMVVVVVVVVGIYGSPSSDPRHCHWDDGEKVKWEKNPLEVSDILWSRIGVWWAGHRRGWSSRNLRSIFQEVV